MGKLTFFSPQAKLWPAQLGLDHHPPNHPHELVQGKVIRAHWCSLGRVPSLSKHQCTTNPHLHRNWGQMAQSYLMKGWDHSIQDASSRMSQVYWEFGLVSVIPCSCSASTFPTTLPSQWFLSNSSLQAFVFAKFCLDCSSSVLPCASILILEVSILMPPPLSPP